MHWTNSPRWVLALAALGLAACHGSADSEDADTMADEAGTGDTGTDTGTDDDCPLSNEPIRRLTQSEYVNTVGTLFPGVNLPMLDPIPDERVDGFIGHNAGQSASALGVARYEALAEGIADAAAGSLDSWAPCSDDSSACAQSIALELGWKVYRRPLDADETLALSSFAGDAYGEFGLELGVAVVVEALLQSPFFLYRPEFGEPGGAVVTLGDYEMASRLSYFFLDDMPDEALFAAAAAGELTSDAGVEAQARRLLADPRARPILTDFMGEWLRLYELGELALDPVVFPEFTPQMQADLEESIHRYLDKALWEDDSWDALMTGSFGFVNDDLAPLYGVAAPGSDAMTLVELDPSQRAGVLTQPGLLASTSHGISHSPIYRGVTMLDNILCTPVPAPPPGVLDETEPLPVPPEELCTTRDYVSKTHTNRAECEGCHNLIDPAGFVFEHYDALGRYRVTENDCPIDASASFPSTVGEVSDDARKLIDITREAMWLGILEVAPDKTIGDIGAVIQ
ncbi:MAG: DUF1592 domain-containing protein, partial [Myxococcales bacterium]|nr:DUF1592 domain-containing protein [Myxococcales bacterium]